MSWGKKLFEVNFDEKLLYWVLLWAIGPSENLPIDYFIRKFLKKDGGCGGDPDWEIEYRLEKNGRELYYVWANSEISGIEFEEKEYSSETVKKMLRQMLFEFSEAYPERWDEVQEIILKYKL
jgi:hypothetical protein